MNSTARIGAISGPHNLRTLAGILSGPEALFVSIKLRSCSIPSTEKEVSGIAGYGEFCCDDRFDTSSRVKVM